jgi:trehalose 2-sulfotransferase
MDMKNNLVAQARNKIQSDYPDIPLAAKSFIVLFIPRSGSNLLSTQLAEIGYGNPVEAFHFSKNFRKRVNWGIDFNDPHAFMKAALSYVAVGGVAGVKINPVQFQIFLGIARQLLGDLAPQLNEAEITEVFFPDVKYLHIQRRKKIDQAVSLSKALQNGIWKESVDEDTEYKKYLLPAVYDREFIECCLDVSLANDFFWTQYLRKYELPVFSIYYEDLAGDYINKMKAVYQFLGVSKTSNITPQTRKQSTSQSNEWVTRFVTETDWLKEPDFAQAYESSDLETLFYLRSRKLIVDHQTARWNQIPAIKFKPFRSFWFNATRKIKSITGSKKS